jgi:hypothetical protein
MNIPRSGKASSTDQFKQNQLSNIVKLVAILLTFQMSNTPEEGVHQ